MKQKLLLCFLLFICTTGFAQHGKYLYFPITGRNVLSRTQGSNWLALKEGQSVEIKPGDMINVEGAGRGELFFPDGTIVRMKNGAMVTVQRYGVFLRSGYCWFTVSRSVDVFRVTMPLGSCAVLGTSFDVEVDQFGKTQVRVFEGIVAVRAGDSIKSRQLVLQAGMSTKLTDSKKVSDKPDRFNSSTAGASIKSEWEHRNIISSKTEGIYNSFQGYSPKLIQLRNGNIITKPTKIDSSLSKGEDSKENETVSESVSSAPIVTQPSIFEPVIYTEEPVAELDKNTSQDFKQGPVSYRSLIRERSEFQNVLFNRQLARDSSIGGYNLKKKMNKDGFGTHFGHGNDGNLGVFPTTDTHREYRRLEMRLNRLQGEIQQSEAKIREYVAENKPTLTQKNRIAGEQSRLRALKIQHRFMQNRMKALSQE